MIPVARKLREMKNNVIIASGEEHLSLFRTEIPGITCISFPGFKPSYSRHLPQYLYLLIQTPVLFYHIIKEHVALKQIIIENDIDFIISDNRFGLWRRKIPSVYITHMPLIPLPKPFRFLEPAGVFLHRQIIKKYSLCFIPDMPGTVNLSGRLSHGMRLPGNVRYIGILSRFAESEVSSQEPIQKQDYTVVVLSGPQPQKEILRQKLITILRGDKSPAVFLEGKPGSKAPGENDNNITFYDHLPESRMRKILEESTNIITRSGYTTVMELVSLNCTALIIPTPGQTEQEYLAEYLSGKGWFSTVSQNAINKDLHFPARKILNYADLRTESDILLTKALTELLDINHKQG
jgi:hypothetical protein